MAKYRASLSFYGLTEKYPQPFNYYNFIINNNIALHDLIILMSALATLSLELVFL